MEKNFSRVSRLFALLGLMCCLVLLIAIPFVGGASENKVNPQKNTPPDVPNEGVKLLIRSQSDSPLVLIAKSNILPPTKTFYVELVAKNLSKKPIRSYAIRQDILAGGHPYSGVDLAMKVSKKLLFLPGQSIKEEVSGIYSDYVDSIRISVDFVEFDDGSTWGQDTFNSSERIAGIRAGAREMRKRLSQMLHTGEVNAVLSEVEAESLEIAPPPDKSEVWLQGFKTGASKIRARIKNTPTKGDRGEIEKVLRQPIDASEGRL